jgi:hypothetical protein
MKFFISKKERQEIERKKIEEFQELERLRIVEIVRDVRNRATILSQMVRFIKDYGNITRRKNSKLKHGDFMRTYESIISIPLSLCVASSVIARDPRASAEYADIMAKVQKQLEIEIGNAQRPADSAEKPEESTEVKEEGDGQKNIAEKASVQRDL